MLARFYLQIVTEDGEKIRFAAGGAAEAELIDLCAKEILSRGVGIFRTEAQVEQRIREGIHDAVYRFKERIVRA